MNYLTLIGATIIVLGTFSVILGRDEVNAEKPFLSHVLGMIAGLIFLIIGTFFFGAGTLKFYFNDVLHMNNEQVNEWYNKTYK